MGKELTGRKPRRSGRRKLRPEDGLRAGVLLLLVAILTALFPSQPVFDIDTARLGKISREEVIAPETFDVKKPIEEYEAEKADARRNVSPILVESPAVPSLQADAVDSLFAGVLSAAAADSGTVQTLRRIHPAASGISDASLRHLMRTARSGRARLQQLRRVVQAVLSETYESGVLPSKEPLPASNGNRVTITGDGPSRSIPSSEVLGLDELGPSLREAVALRLPDGSPLDTKAATEIVAAFLAPNLAYDSETTEYRRAQAAEAVSDTKVTVHKDERIIDEHELVTPEHIEKLEALDTHMAGRGQQSSWARVLRVGAQAVLVGFLMAILFGYLKVFRTPAYVRTSNLVLFGILVLMPTVVAHYAATSEIVREVVVPIALSAMLATVLFDAAVGLVVTMVCAALCASILGSLQYNLIFMITGVIGAYSARQVLHRADFYRPIAYLGAAYTLTILVTSVDGIGYKAPSEFFRGVQSDIIYGLFTAASASILTIGLLPIFESVFTVVTPITLLELSDLNRPLLRNLAIRAPGTYSHSIIMASLSEAAADAIGADRLLSRVGCYYHDIGKMIRPHYFIENQKGVNPHDELQPKMSALILISHVKDGVELAREEGLPPAIVDLIPQHHGTSEIASFKHRALERGDKQAVRDEDFRYPGPKPQTKEAGIINLADAVESATRTLPSNSPDRLKGMVQTIIRGRFTSGELDECDLTLRDLTKIQDAFLPILQATRHARVLYPWQKEPEAREPRRERT